MMNGILSGIGPERRVYHADGLNVQADSYIGRDQVDTGSSESASGIEQRQDIGTAGSHRLLMPLNVFRHFS
jgi:hypothetical protein